jgi:hypothetical protein
MILKSSLVTNFDMVKVYFFLFLAMINDFLIIERDDLSRSGITGESVKRSYTLNFNNATVAELYDGRFIVVPLVGDFCISTCNKTLLENWVANKQFPIGRETDDPFEVLSFNVDSMDQHFIESKEEISRLFSIPLTEVDTVDYKVLDSAINEAKRKLNDQELERAYVALNIYLLERFRNNCMVPIKPMKIETLNTYYVPVLDFRQGRSLFDYHSFRRELDEGLSRQNEIYTESLIKFALIGFYNFDPFGLESQQLFKEKIK